MSSAAQHFYFETKIHLNHNSVFFYDNCRDLFPVQNYTVKRVKKPCWRKSQLFYILSLLCIKIILILNKMATLDRWSQNINDLFGKFNCMYLYINTSSNLKMEPKVNEINWKNTFVRHWKKRITHTRTWLRGSQPEYGTLYTRAPMPVSTASVRTPSHTETERVNMCYIQSILSSLFIPYIL